MVSSATWVVAFGISKVAALVVAEVVLNGVAVLCVTCEVVFFVVSSGPGGSLLVVCVVVGSGVVMFFFTVDVVAVVAVGSICVVFDVAGALVVDGLVVVL